MTSFDRRQLRRTLAYGFVALVLAAGIVVATDEATSTLRHRIARLGALAPALAAVAVLAASARLCGRGEDVALAALGVSPWRLARASIVGGWMMSGLAVALLATEWADARALFPVVGRVVAFEPWQDGFHSLEAGIFVDSTGRIRGLPTAVDVGAPPGPSASAALWVVGLLGAAAPPWAAAPITAAPRVAGFAVTVLLTVVGLHGLAVSRLSSPTLALAVVPLVLQTARAFVRARRLGPSSVAGTSA